MADLAILKMVKIFVPINRNKISLLPERLRCTGLGNAVTLIADIYPKTGKTVMLAFDHGYFQGPIPDLNALI